MKNVFCPVLQNVQDTPLCPLSDSSEWDSGPGEMAGCVLILTAGCSADQPAANQSPVAGARAGPGHCACIKPILRIIINSELTLLTPTATQVGLTLSTSDQTLLVIQSRPVIQILIHSLPLG